MFAFKLGKAPPASEGAGANAQTVAAIFPARDDEEEGDKATPEVHEPKSWFKEVVPLSDSDNNDDSNQVESPKERAKEASTENSSGSKNASVSRVDLEPASKKMKVAGLVSLGRYAAGNAPRPQPRYIDGLLQRATHREMEQEVIKETLLKKEQREEEQVFVTGAYKKRLTERRAFEERMAEQDMRDALNDPKKKKDLTSFHHYMLTKGLASRTSVGREKSRK